MFLLSDNPCFICPIIDKKIMRCIFYTKNIVELMHY